ncbi:glycoside hydrolase family 9 protein [Cellulomonas terrae]|uniref:Endoglucanase n=1 Tax=Cellulomonas terrae TaxID=311234 RepID=A0A511JKU3_9CELL|nr:glycoside hydrolase family 9 protein [Cellulomonas terrae]GEL98566.1 endoglucanase [Cellulomonas terrae]
MRPVLPLVAVLLLATAVPAAAADGPELVPNGSFDAEAAPWWTTPDMVADTSSGSLCVDVPGGSSTAWSSIVGVDGVPLVKGETYRFAFTASGTAEVPIRALVQMNTEPWTSTSEVGPVMQPEPQPYEVGFTSTMDWPAGQVVFQVGGAADDWRFCVDEVSVHTGELPAPFEQETATRVRVNQVGYLPTGPKRASLVTEKTDPLPWRLLDTDGEEVATGTTTPRGEDRTADENVHVITFDEVDATGEGFTLVTDGETSHPFAISADLYADLATDAFGYFYLARSGIEIDGALVGDEYARPAGHLDVAPNTGDTAVGCQAPQPWYAGWTCDGTFDVRGGWYDAGDHGKYVVNGGIAVHQLLDTWERALVVQGRKTAEAGPLADGTARIPEAGNGVPDVLDEARWELEWMQRMQVPAGQEHAGLVFHKVQDDGWTGLPLAPDEDPQTRQVHRPSTAATLNLAAVAAKGARLWEPYDEEFAAGLLESARVAWAAAVETPDLYASALDGNEGGGPYDDKDVSDEFYWAAAELYLTTGEDEFADAVTGSPVHSADLAGAVAFDWQRTAALGRMDLALVPSDLTDRDAVRDSVVTLADFALYQQGKAFFGQPYQPSDARFEWGSNGIILNNAVTLAAAADLTGDETYRTAALESLDHVLGRNALDQSYVTGYGTQFSQNQHHRTFAAQLDPTLPHPPAGTLSGGPNSSIQDPVAAQTWPQGCVAQRCYLDDIQSWSTNEMTINWNSSLTWMAVWASSDEVVENGPKVVLPFRLWMVGAVVVGLLALTAVGLVVVRRRRT